MKPKLMNLCCALALLALGSGCMSQDVPPAHRGQMFDRTGALGLYLGGKGFSGDILGPGTYWTGIYDEVRVVDCSQRTKNESLQSLTRDGVQFGLDVRVTYRIDCSDETMSTIMATIQPNADRTISSEAAYATYVRPAIGEAVREAISPHLANDINRLREKVLPDIRQRFVSSMEQGNRRFVKIGAVALNNMDFPDAMDVANTDRATQGILREKAVAERARVEAETETARMRKALRQQEGEAEAARIDAIGAALNRNPLYLQFDLQQRMPEIYRKAGAQGNLVITAPSPTILLQGSRGSGGAAQ
jgi:regulator of protease activity HflC (stomatin/prohibitin superfamily)